MKIPLLKFAIFCFIVTGALFPSLALAAGNTSIVHEEFKVDSEDNQLHVHFVKDTEDVSPRPTVLFLVGSGEFSTVASYRKFISFFLEEPLLEDGYNVAFFDKRGVGDSTGVWYEASFETRALDAANVARELIKREDVDSSQLFVVGHSQGGWIVQVALASYPDLFAGGISMAGPTFSVRRQLENDYMSQYLCASNVSSEKALRKAQRRVSLIRFAVRLVGRSGNLKQLKVIQDFEPSSYLREITQPFLMLFGENDPLVNPSWSLSSLHDLFPEAIPDNFEYHVGANQEHAFRIAPLCAEERKRNLDYSPETRDYILRWLGEVTSNHLAELHPA